MLDMAIMVIGFKVLNHFESYNTFNGVRTKRLLTKCLLTKRLLDKTPTDKTPIGHNAYCDETLTGHNAYWT